MPLTFFATVDISQVMENQDENFAKCYHCLQADQTAYAWLYCMRKKMWFCTCINIKGR